MDREELLEKQAALLAQEGWEPMRLARTPVGTCIITSEPFVVMDQIMIRVEKSDGKKRESFMFRALRVWPFALSLASIHIEFTKSGAHSRIRHRIRSESKRSCVNNHPDFKRLLGTAREAGTER